MKEIHDVSLRADQGADAQRDFLARYPDVAKIAEDFETAHLKVLQDATAVFETEDAVRAQFNVMHYAIKSRYAAIAEARRTVGGEDEAVNRNPVSKLKLPKISLPHFSGDVTLWPSFFALFTTSIHDNTQLSDMEKYQYLLSSLSGEALNVIKNLQFSAEHYAIAFDMLVARYQNKRKLATHYWHALTQAKPLRINSAASLRQLLDTFNENTRALKLMKFRWNTGTLFSLTFC